MNEVPLCVVCLQELCNHLTCAPCGHVFHKGCIKKCLESKPNCPLCRDKVYLQNLIDISYEVTKKSEDGGVTESKIVTCLTEKIEIYEQKLENQEYEIEKIKNSREMCIAKINRLQQKYAICKGKLKNSDFLNDKYNCELKATIDEYSKCKESLEKLENVSKFITDLEASKSIIPWMITTTEIFSVSQQIEHFKSALLVSSNNLRETEKNYKKIKETHAKCEESIGTLKKQILNFRKEEMLKSVKSSENLPIKVTNI